MNPKYQKFLVEGEQVGARYSLAPPRQLPSGQAGMRLGQQAGNSLEFREHREYQPGDDLRRIDWGVLARSDKLTVKLYQNEVNPHVDIVVDGSGSMALADTVKVQATLSLAAVLASSARQSGFSHCAWLTSEGCQPIANGTASPSLWDSISFTGDGDPLKSFATSPPSWRPQSTRILISDLLWMGDPRQLLHAFTDRCSHVIVLQVLSEKDMEPPKEGAVQLVDSETGEAQNVVIDAMVQQRYRESFSRHQQHWLSAARQVGAAFVTVVAEKVVSNWQLDELVAAEILHIQ